MKGTHSAQARIFWRRFGAIFYDVLLLIAIYFVLTAVALLYTGGQAIEQPAYKLFLLLVAALFFDWCWRRGGQTLGMQAWQIKIVSDDGERLNHGQTLTRFFVGLCTLGLSLLSIPFRQDGRALHDIASRSHMIRKER